MNAADVPTIENILDDYLDTNDPYYATMIEALRNRENIMVTDAEDRIVNKLAENLLHNS